MKRFTDIDEYQQSIPRRKPMKDTETGASTPFGIRYVKQEEFDAMQETLNAHIEEQNSLLLQALVELQQMKLHLAAMSHEDIDETDVEVE